MIFARYFVLVSAAVVASGWTLSAFRLLNATGYVLTIPAFFISLAWACSVPAEHHQSRLRRWRTRLRKPSPALFLVLGILVIAGGIRYSPSNYDFLTYRLSRLLHWEHYGGWHWITTANERMNYSGANAEWLMAPLFIFTGSDRLLFLPSVVSFFLLPAAVYTVFRGMGLAKQAAWFAMWTVPTAYCYVAQAGGAGNDLLGTCYFLLALSFAIRAQEKQQIGWLYASGLSIALCTGTKATNLPLMLPWLTAAVPAVFAFRPEKPLKFTLVAFSAVVVSLAPIVLANVLHSKSSVLGGDEQEKLSAGSVAAGLLGNSAAIAVGSLQPPVLPSPTMANEIAAKTIPADLETLLARDFPRLQLKFAELANEESAGLGLGVTLLVFATVYAWLLCTRRNGLYLNIKGWLLLAGLIIALVSYMSVAASESAARLLSPYYPVLLAVPFALAGSALLYRRAWWRNLCFCCAASALPIPLLTPSRPVLPAQALAEVFDFPPSLSSRVDAVYSVYANRADNLRPLRELLAAKDKSIGLIATGDDIETSLWRPFGSGKSVRHIAPTEPLPTELQAAVVSSLALSQKYRIDPQRFVSETDASPDWQLAGTRKIISKVQEGPVEWIVFTRENPSAGGSKETSENASATK